MSDFYDDEVLYRSRGVDSDLAACLRYNPQWFTLSEIVRVHAVFEGENEGENWRWVLELTGGRYVLLEGGCDYTGWDCSSWATTSEIQSTPGLAARQVLSRDNNYGASPQAVYDALLVQVGEGKKAATWRERIADEMEG